MRLYFKHYIIQSLRWSHMATLSRLGRPTGVGRPRRHSRRVGSVVAFVAWVIRASDLRSVTRAYGPGINLTRAVNMLEVTAVAPKSAGRGSHYVCPGGLTCRLNRRWLTPLLSGIVLYTHLIAGHQRGPRQRAMPTFTVELRSGLRVLIVMLNFLMIWPAWFKRSSCAS